MMPKWILAGHDAAATQRCEEVASRRVVTRAGSPVLVVRTR